MLKAVPERVGAGDDGGSLIISGHIEMWGAVDVIPVKDD